MLVLPISMVSNIDVIYQACLSNEHSQGEQSLLHRAIEFLQCFGMGARSILQLRQWLLPHCFTHNISQALRLALASLEGLARR